MDTLEFIIIKFLNSTNFKAMTQVCIMMENLMVQVVLPPCHCSYLMSKKKRLWPVVNRIDPHLEPLCQVSTFISQLLSVLAANSSWMSPFLRKFPIKNFNCKVILSPHHLLSTNNDDCTKVFTSPAPLDEDNTMVQFLLRAENHWIWQSSAETMSSSGFCLLALPSIFHSFFSRQYPFGRFSMENLLKILLF